ncbi:MAG: sigma 54-interacting transcriptional regulator [Desulfomonilaceae bacterium]|nr:sigma 54-interacting transcriptional regulator [Desulfomonilaceae bacterium]
MKGRSLKGKLIVGVSALVIGSGVLLSVLVTQRYTAGLRFALSAQAESLAHAVALEATEKVLVNDVVALQKLLENQIRSNPSISYMFVQRDGRISAHTFPSGVPAGLLDANEPMGPKEGRAKDVRSTDGQRYVDIAWPIFEGKAGVLRLGISQAAFREQVRRLWFEIGAVTLAILVLALAGGLLYVGRITRPLAELTEAAQKLDEGTLDLTVQPHGNAEVAALASSFNGMVSRIRDFTQRVEEKTRELERSHEQTRAFCEIVREIGSLPSLEEVCSTLIHRIVGILSCTDMALLVLNDSQDKLYVAWEKGLHVVHDEERLREFYAIADSLDTPAVLEETVLRPPLVPDFFASAAKQLILPLENEYSVRGVLAVACPGECTCHFNQMDWVSLILSQSAGVVRRAVLQADAADDLHARLSRPSGFRGLIGKDSKMQAVYRLIEDIARTDVSVLIQGESGTGKELVARAIHLESERKDKNFVVINCSAYPETLLESELFGHEKGAFTGAVRRRSGRFEQADGGTVFLDEIGEISPQAQIKLLRVLQTRTFERVGGDETLSVDIRVIAATNKDLAREVQSGRFREDLFFRLNVIRVVLPPLRDRRNDIPALADHFLRHYSKEQGKDVQGFSSDAMRLMLDYGWPGNVRELENSVEHAVVLAKGPRVEAADLPSVMWPQRVSSPVSGISVMEASEKETLARALEQCGWNKKEAAKRLGIGRTTLYAKLKKYGLTRPVIQ